MGNRPLARIASALLLVLVCSPAFIASASDDDEVARAMDNARLGALLNRLDLEVRGEPGFWQLVYESTPALVVTDEAADRMRIMIEVADAEELPRAELYRLLQANYESALDARYAVAHGKVWSVFIHPLSPLTERQLRLAIAQTYNVAFTFGDTYSGGLFEFNGGDRRRKAIEDLLAPKTPT
ncbi:MAG: hypothetical protein AAF515_14735 [Pseudomonadota bacterium]